MNMIVCAWCKKLIEWGTLPVSHGICPNCAEKLERQIKEMEGKK